MITPLSNVDVQALVIIISSLSLLHHGVSVGILIMYSIIGFLFYFWSWKYPCLIILSAFWLCFLLSVSFLSFVFVPVQSHEI